MPKFIDLETMKSCNSVFTDAHVRARSQSLKMISQAIATCHLHCASLCLNLIHGYAKFSFHFANSLDERLFLSIMLLCSKEQNLIVQHAKRHLSYYGPGAFSNFPSSFLLFSFPYLHAIRLLFQDGYNAGRFLSSRSRCGLGQRAGRSASNKLQAYSVSFFPYFLSAKRYLRWLPHSAGRSENSEQHPRGYQHPTQSSCCQQACIRCKKQP